MEKPVIAIMYDFDKTLCTTNMQEYSFIPEIGLTADEFWSQSNELPRMNRWILSFPISTSCLQNPEITEKVFAERTL